MDTVKLLRAIEERRNQAEKEAKVIVQILETQLCSMPEWKNQILSITYRIKEKRSIAEKIEYLKLHYPEKTDLEILDWIKDIIGITIETKELADHVYVQLALEKVIKQLKIEKCDFIDRLNIAGVTGFRAQQLYFKPIEGIPYEIQITDTKNIQIRESTHEAFKNEKYKAIRFPNNTEKKEKIEKEQGEIGEK